jgi:hypothetical protein
MVLSGQLGQAHLPTGGVLDHNFPLIVRRMPEALATVNRQLARAGPPGGHHVQPVLVTARKDRASAPGDHCLRGQPPDIARRPYKTIRPGMASTSWAGGVAFDRAGHATRPAAAEFAAGPVLTPVPCLRSMVLVVTLRS